MSEQVQFRKDVHQGLNIRWFRKIRKLSQEELSNMLPDKILQQDISKIEHRREINDDILDAFAKALNVGIEYLRDYVCYTGGYSSITLTYDNSHLFKDSAKQEIHNPLDVLKNTYDESIDRLSASNDKSIALIIEANEKTTKILQDRIEELKAELQSYKV